MRRALGILLLVALPAIAAAPKPLTIQQKLDILLARTCPATTAPPVVNPPVTPTTPAVLEPVLDPKFLALVAQRNPQLGLDGIMLFLSRGLTKDELAYAKAKGVPDLTPSGPITPSTPSGPSSGGGYNDGFTFEWAQSGRVLINSLVSGVTYTYTYAVPGGYTGTVGHEMVPIPGTPQTGGIAWESESPGGTPIAGTYYAGSFGNGALPLAQFRPTAGRTYYFNLVVNASGPFGVQQPRGR